MIYFIYHRMALGYDAYQNGTIAYGYSQSFMKS